MEETVVVMNYGDRVDILFQPATNETQPSLTGKTIAVLIAKNYGDTAVITKTVGSGIAWTDQPDGDFVAQVMPADSPILDVGEHKMAAKITAPSEAIRTIGEVRLVIEDTVREV